MFSWNELVSLGLISKLADPELVIYFMRILKPLRRSQIEEEAREWHKSLRTTQEERWKRMAELSQKRKYQEMNASVPITCTLPFDGGMWRNSRLLLRSIRYFRRGFIKCPCWTDEMEEFALHHYYHGPGPPEEMENSQKVGVVNLMLGDSVKSRGFRAGWGVMEIQEALEDFILVEEDEEAERSDDDEGADEDTDELTDEEREMKPYLLIERIRPGEGNEMIMDIVE